MNKYLRIFLFISLGLYFVSCKDSVQGPNEIGGSADVAFTKLGAVTGCTLTLNGTYLNNLNDSIVVTKNDGGNVTTTVKFGFDTAATKKLDTLFGTSGFSASAKKTLLELYLKKFGAKIDTTNKNAMTLEMTLRTKVTSEGIQDYMYGGGDLSKPFTMVKYNCAVGDKYEFTDVDNVKITRTVVKKSTTDDYLVGGWYLKVMQVEETKEDAVISKITYVFNHKFGIVGANVVFKTGKTAYMGFMPPNMK